MGARNNLPCPTAAGISGKGYGYMDYARQLTPISLLVCFVRCNDTGMILEATKTVTGFPPDALLMTSA